jgi:hypothetical protein
MSHLSVLALPATFLLVMCNTSSVEITVTNKSRYFVTDVSLVAGERLIKAEDIHPGSSRRVAKWIKGEGAPILHFRRGSKMVAFETCYYTAGSATHGEVIILDNDVQRRCH